MAGRGVRANSPAEPRQASGSSLLYIENIPVGRRAIVRKYADLTTCAQIERGELRRSCSVAESTACNAPSMWSVFLDERLECEVKEKKNLLTGTRRVLAPRFIEQDFFYNFLYCLKRVSVSLQTSCLFSRLSRRTHTHTYIDPRSH